MDSSKKKKHSKKGHFNNTLLKERLSPNLREIKQMVLGQLSSVEKGCLNDYELESYLIQLHSNGNLKDKDKVSTNYNDPINLDAVLTEIRLTKNFWNCKSEKYLTLLPLSQSITEFENGYINKELFSIYNFTTLNSIKEDNSSQNRLEEKVTKEEILLNDILNRNILFGVNQNTKSIYSFSLIRFIYSYVIQSHSLNNKSKIQAQNIILFFITNNDLYLQQEETIHSQTEKIKEYSLRNPSKYNDSSRIKEQKDIESQLKISSNKEELNRILSNEPIKLFLSFIQITPSNCRNIINSTLLLSGKSIQSEEANSAFILSAFILLSNVLSISQTYLRRDDNVKPMEKNGTKEFMLEQCRTILSLSKVSYDTDSSSASLNDLIAFYCNEIENNEENETCKRIQSKGKFEIKETDPSTLINACDYYLNDYYNKEETKQLRECNNKIKRRRWHDVLICN